VLRLNGPMFKQIGHLMIREGAAWKVIVSQPNLREIPCFALANIQSTVPLIMSQSDIRLSAVAKRSAVTRAESRTVCR